MPTKPWYLSKAVWTAVVTAILGVWEAIGPIQQWPTIPPIIFAILGALGVTFRATAKTTLTK